MGLPDSCVRGKGPLLAGPQYGSKNRKGSRAKTPTSAPKWVLPASGDTRDRGCQKALRVDPRVLTYALALSKGRALSLSERTGRFERAPAHFGCKRICNRGTAHASDAAAAPSETSAALSNL